MDNLVILISIVVGVVGLIFLVNFLQKRGYFGDEDLEKSKKILEIAELVFYVVNKNEELKQKATFVFDLTEIVVNYIDEIMDENVDKKEIVLGVIEQLVKKFELTVSEIEWQLIEIIVTEGLKLEKKV